MSYNIQELFPQVSALQAGFWQTIANSASEAVSIPINFENPFTITGSFESVADDYSVPHVVAQFCFSELPDHPLVILLSQDAALTLANGVKDDPPSVVDENIVTDLRQVLEGIVQGACIATSNLVNDSIVATSLTLRYQNLTPPETFLNGEEIFITNVAFEASEFGGTLVCMMDATTAAYLTGVKPQDDADEETSSPFSQIQSGFSPAASISSGLSSAPSNGLEMLYDIPLEVSVELGRVRMPVRDVIELGAGSIVEIDKAAGEPVDVLVNGRLIARGEVVVIEDNFGVRITEILSPQERLNRLNEAA